MALNHAHAAPPNIVFLMADDLGYGELGAYGQQRIATPVLDDLARRGMKFEQFYAGSPVCSPSRAVLMTGQHAGHASIRGNLGFFDAGRKERVALRKDELTLGEMLKGAGYQTAYVGKWHLGVPDDPSTWAFSRGFDFAIQTQWGRGANGKSYQPRDYWLHGDQESLSYRVDDYDSIDHFRTTLAMDFLDQKNDDKPFFLFMSYRAPHGHERRIGNSTLYADKVESWGAMQRLHAAKISILDREIGRLLDRLERDGDLENTLVIFTSDNGPHAEGKHVPNPFLSAGGFRGIKRDVYEGGLRVPMIAYWKGRIAPGTTSDHLATFYDVMPTFAELADIPVPGQTDGISFLPTLTGQAQETHAYLYFEMLHAYNGQFRQAVRQGPMKSVRNGKDGRIELYNLDTDRAENADLGLADFERVMEMEALMNQSRNDVPGFAIDSVLVK